MVTQLALEISLWYRNQSWLELQNINGLCMFLLNGAVESAHRNVHIPPTVVQTVSLSQACSLGVERHTATQQAAANKIATKLVEAAKHPRGA